MVKNKRMITILLILIGGIFGAIGAFQLQKMGLDPVVSSCIIGLVGYLVGYFTNNEDLALVIFAGSFVGMTAVSIATVPMMLVAGILCGLLFIVTEPIFGGYGGKLGAIAFVSVGVVLLIFQFSKNFQ